MSKTCNSKKITIQNFSKTVGNYVNGSYDKICKEKETDEVLSPTNTLSTYMMHLFAPWKQIAKHTNLAKLIW